MSINIPKGLTKKKSTSSGFYCDFYDITRQTGLKLFHTKKDCFCCWMIHSVLAKHAWTKSCVPKVRSKPIKVGNKWGYAVEKVNVCNTYLRYGKCSCPTCKAWSQMSRTKRVQKRELMLNVLLKHIPNFEDWTNYFKLDDTPYNEEMLQEHIENVLYDDHEGNWGSKKGKLLWIDFSN
jgi:hypothetical protein